MLHAIGVPEAVTMMSMVSSVTGGTAGDEEGQEERLEWSMV